MRAKIKIKYSKDPLMAKETFETLKKRIFNADSFIYVATDRKKMILNKSMIISVKTIPVEKKKATKKD